MSKDRILLVDDQENVLDSFRRQLRGKFDVHTAISGFVALDMLEKEEPFSVIVSDLSMPEINGVEFLSRAFNAAPDTVRIMLTGNIDQASAAAAINEGRVFKFLNKPCEIPDLTQAIKEGVQLNRKLTAEHTLLQDTLSGSVKVLLDLLSSLEPQCVGSSGDARPIIRVVCREMNIADGISIELAALLAPIGFALLAPEIRAKLKNGEELSVAERNEVELVPKKGGQLIKSIPRLEKTSEIIYHLNSKKNEEAPLGTRILKIILDVQELSPNFSVPDSLRIALLQRKETYDEDVFDDVIDCLSTIAKQEVTDMILVGFKDLRVGHTILSDIKRKDGILLLRKGVQVTKKILERLDNHQRVCKIMEPIAVNSD